MTSKKKLEAIRGILYETLEFHTDADELINPIIKDLERLETFDYIVEQNVNLREKVNHFKNVKNRWKRNYKFVDKENEKLKKAIDILKDKLDIKLEIYHNGGCTLNYKIISNCITSNDRCLRHLEVEKYELLEEVL